MKILNDIVLRQNRICLWAFLLKNNIYILKKFKLHFFIGQEINKGYLKISEDWISYEKQDNVSLKTTKFPLFCIRTTIFGLSLIPSSRVIPDLIPAVVRKHRWILFSLISFLHSCNVLVESVPLLITYFSTAQWKEI